MAVHFFPESNGSGGGGSTGNYIPLTQKGTANGVATLDSSAKVPASQLPDISITNTFVVATEAEMLALNAQTGDIAVRTDTNKTLILKTSPASVISNWVELATPTNGVFSVDGKTGAVTLSNTYQAKSNELTALSALTDTPGFIKKVGDGVYAVDTTAYLSVMDASIFYQPLNSNLTSISGITGTYGFLVKTLQGWELNTSGYQHASPLLTGIANLTGDGYLEKVGTGWVLNPGPFQPLNPHLTAITGVIGNGFLTKTVNGWAVDNRQFQLANNELSGFSALADTAGFVVKTGDGTYTLDANTYLTTTLASSSYQPLNTNLTGISGLAGTSGVPRKTAGVWSLDATSYLTGNQTITLSGDVSGSGTTAITATLANVATAGTYPKVTINAKGLVTSGANLTAADIPNLDWAKITTGKPTTLAGYNIGDAYTKTETDTAISTYGYSKQAIDTSLASKQNTSNELTGFIALADTAGFIKKTGDGTYAIDTNTYLTSASLASSYQPLNANLTGISGITGTSGFIKQTNGVWSLDASSYITGNQTITLSGDATGSGTTSIPVTISSLDWSKIASKPTTISGYGITNAYTKTEVDTSLAGKQNTSNELTGFIALPDTAGFIKKTGDGTYALDPNTYVTTSSATSTYQPLNINLTGISAIAADGFLVSTGGVWGMDQRQFQIANNELTGLIGLPDTNGLIRKTGDGTYSLDNSSYLTGNQTITLSGDATGSGTTAIAVTLPNVVTAGSSAKPTYNAKGLITGSGSLLPSDIPNIDASKITTGLYAPTVGTLGATAGDGLDLFSLSYGASNVIGLRIDARRNTTNTDWKGTETRIRSRVDATDMGYLSFRNDGTIPRIYAGIGTADIWRVDSGNFSVLTSTVSTSTTTGALTVGGGVGVVGNQYIGGFSSLGGDANHPAIKIKVLTGTTDSAEGGTASVTHGITASKIVSISVLVEYAAGAFIPDAHNIAPGYYFDFYSESASVSVRNKVANSSYILSKPFKVTIIYTD